MARRTAGQRYQPAQAAVVSAQARGQTSALQALRDYRAGGGTIRTQEWYRIWRGGKQLPQPPTPPKPPPGGGRRPRNWITNVGVVYLDPRDNSYRTHWHRIYSEQRRRISDAEAVQRAIDEGDPTGDRYGWVPVLAYVTSYEPVY